MKKFVTMTFVLIAALALAACGGSGGGSSAPAVGTFSLAFISDEGGTAETGLYDVDFAAGGVYNFSTTTTSGTPESATGTYVNNGDGSLTADGSMQFRISGNAEMLGALDSDGSTQSIMVGAKQGSGLSETILDGEYAVYQFGADGAVDSYTVVADASFNGAAATVSFTAISLSDGGSVPDILSEAYTVSDSGLLQIPGADLTGQVSSNGQVVVMVDVEDVNNPIQLGVMIKKVAGGAAPLGTFVALQYMDEISGAGDRMANAAVITFGAIDGSGDGLLDYQDVNNPAESATGVPFNYDSVAGTLTITPPGDPAETTHITVSPDGTAFVLCDNDDNGGTDSVHVFVGMKM